jgi:hypothetical protein
MTSDGGGGTWTTVIEIPITALSGEIDASLRESNCIAALSVADGEEIPVTVTLTTQEQTMCGGGEEITERAHFAVLTNLVIDVTPGEGTTTECPIMHNGLQNGSPRNAVETEIRWAIYDALGDLDLIAPIGATCTQCTGACDGLACD